MAKQLNPSTFTHLKTGSSIQAPPQPEPPAASPFLTVTGLLLERRAGALAHLATLLRRLQEERSRLASLARGVDESRCLSVSATRCELLEEAYRTYEQAIADLLDPIEAMLPHVSRVK